MNCSFFAKPMDLLKRRYHLYIHRRLRRSIWRTKKEKIWVQTIGRKISKIVASLPAQRPLTTCPHNLIDDILVIAIKFDLRELIVSLLNAFFFACKFCFCCNESCSVESFYLSPMSILLEVAISAYFFFSLLFHRRSGCRELQGPLTSGNFIQGNRRCFLRSSLTGFFVFNSLSSASLIGVNSDIKISKLSIGASTFGGDVDVIRCF